MNPGKDLASPKDVKAKILEADKKLASREDINNDAVLVSNADSNWETLLCPAPLGIAVLGDLMVVASSTADFPLKVPEKPYEHLKYPDSFRASLVQISNAGYRAFKTAHTNMDKIRLYSMNVPNHMKDVTKILMSDDPKVVSRCLKIPLNRIDEASKECLRLSKDVVECFDGVINVTGELLEACTFTQGVSENERENIRAQLGAKKVANEKYEKILEELNSNKKKLEDEVDGALSDFKRAVDTMPSGIELVATNLLEGVANVFTLKIFSPLNQQQVSSSSASVDMVNQAIGLEEEKRRTRLVHNRSGVVQLSGIVSQLEESASNSFEKLNKAHKQGFNPHHLIGSVKKIKENVQKCDEIKKLCKDILEVMEKMAKLAAKKMLDDDIDELKSQIEKLAETAAEMQSQVQASSLPLQSQSPAAVNMMKNVGESGSAAQMMQENAKLKVSAAQDRLKQSREQAAKVREEILKVNSEYIKSLEEMQKFRASEIRYDEIIQLLRKGLQTLGQLKEHWIKLVRFFQSVSNIVETVMSKELNDFNKYAVEASSDPILNQFILGMIYDSAIKANQASFLIHNMANVYVQVSDRYIMDNLAKLDQLIAFDPATGGSIDVKRGQLLESCKRDSEAITEFVMSERRKIVERIDTRMQQLEEGYAFLKMADNSAEGDEDDQF